MVNQISTKTLQMSQNIMTRNVRGYQLVSYLCFILTYFNIIRSRSQLLFKINVSKDFANFTKKIFIVVLFQLVAGLGLATALK